MKKVIFIGGTSYSGSTLLDMILANDEIGFSCGEVSSLFFPLKKRHIQYSCGCGEKECKIWKEILENGKKNVYHTIFKMFPHVQFIIDSSKNPFWINYQTNRLKKQKIKVENILIYKTPLETAHSFKKRGRLRYFKNSWINYHRLYISLINDFMSVSYKELVSKEYLLERICNQLEITYFMEKNKYWKKEHHTLFGNTSAKMHLLSKNEDVLSQYKNKLENSGRSENMIKEEFQSVYYRKVKDDELEKNVTAIYHKNKKIRELQKVLSEADIKNGKKSINGNINNLRFTNLQIRMREKKWIYNSIIFLNYAKLFMINDYHNYRETQINYK